MWRHHFRTLLVFISLLIRWQTWNVWQQNKRFVSKHVEVVECQKVSNMFDQCPNKQKYCKVLQCLIKCLSLFQFYQTRLNMIKHNQTRCSNRKIFGHQTMFDRVCSPNISHLDRALPYRSKTKANMHYLNTQVRTALWSHKRIFQRVLVNLRVASL